MIKREEVTIVIPHFGASPEAEFALDQCIQSLQETEPEIKRIVVKNGSPCKHAGDIKTDPQGQCRAVNEAVKQVQTPLIMVTNDDMIYPPGWFEKLTEFVGDAFPKKPFCISPKLIEPRPGAPTFETFFCGGAGGDFNKQRFLEFARRYWGESWRPGFNLPFLMGKELWDTIGGYDINYDPWGSNSDSDLEYKIKLAGVQPLQQTNSIVYHFSQTSGTFSPEHQDAWNKNWAYFIEKWGFPRTDEGIWEATFIIPNNTRKFRPEWEGKFYGHTRTR